MDLKHYHHDVYHHFRHKLEEVDFFLGEAIENAREYKSLPSPKDIKYLTNMQFQFSAFISVLISLWEITRLSIDLHNKLTPETRLDLPGERKLETNSDEFQKFFSTDEKVYELFVFLKNARNANAHDGTLSLNGGNESSFKFQTDLVRYFRCNRTKEFELRTSVAPDRDALKVMLLMCIELIPLFRSKLVQPKMEISEQHLFAQQKFDLLPDVIKQFLPEQVNEMVESMAEAQMTAPLVTLDDLLREKLTKWESTKI